MKEVQKEFITNTIKTFFDLGLILFLLATIVHKIAGYKALYIATDSMEPTLKTNQFALAKKATGDEVEIGDIATYKVWGRIYTVTHRVVDIDGDYLIFKGDNNDEADEPVRKDRVIYRVVQY